MLTNEAWKRTSNSPGLHYFDYKHAETVSISSSIKPATMLCMIGLAPEHAQRILYGGGVKAENVARLVRYGGHRWRPDRQRLLVMD